MNGRFNVKKLYVWFFAFFIMILLLIYYFQLPIIRLFGDKKGFYEIGAISSAQMCVSDDNSLTFSGAIVSSIECSGELVGRINGTDFIVKIKSEYFCPGNEGIFHKDLKVNENFSRVTYEGSNVVLWNRSMGLKCGPKL